MIYVLYDILMFILQLPAVIKVLSMAEEMIGKSWDK